MLLFFQTCKCLTGYTAEDKMSHEKQGTGSWAGNRDRHQGRQSNGARKRDGWVDMGKKTNSDRNQGKGFLDQIADAIFGGGKKSR